MSKNVATAHSTAEHSSKRRLERPAARVFFVDTICDRKNTLTCSVRNNLGAQVVSDRRRYKSNEPTSMKCPRGCIK
jgi:hypothetical protein